VLIDAHQRELILKALDQAQWNHAAAAKLLGLPLTYLQQVLKALQIN
jgi:transcriptional regulator with GAF, ATPase, and Fis domain